MSVIGKFILIHIHCVDKIPFCDSSADWQTELLYVNYAFAAARAMHADTCR